MLRRTVFINPVARVSLAALRRDINLYSCVPDLSAGESDAKQEVVDKPIKDHTIALDEVLRHLEATSSTDIRSSMQAVGHRSERFPPKQPYTLVSLMSVHSRQPAPSTIHNDSVRMPHTGIRRKLETHVAHVWLRVGLCTAATSRLPS